MACGTVLRIKDTKFVDILWTQNFGVLLGLTMRRRTTRERDRAEQRQEPKMVNCDHRPFFSMVPGTSTPARTMKGRFSLVIVRDCRATTSPATTPNAICDVVNQYQSIRLSSRVLKRPMAEYSNPDHRTGAMIPPSTIGRLANMGSMAP